MYDLQINLLLNLTFNNGLSNKQSFFHQQRSKTVYFNKIDQVRLVCLSFAQSNLLNGPLQQILRETYLKPDGCNKDKEQILKYTPVTLCKYISV